MPISEYMRDLREAVGSRLILVPAVAAIIRDARGRVLLMQRAEDGGWSLPAGGIDPGESPHEAVVREVAEETGLEVVASRLLTVVGGANYRAQYPGGDKVEFTVCVFACETSGGAPLAVDGEAMGFRWVEPATVPEMLNHPYPPELFVGEDAVER